MRTREGWSWWLLDREISAASRALADLPWCRLVRGRAGLPVPPALDGVG